MEQPKNVIHNIGDFFIHNNSDENLVHIIANEVKPEEMPDFIEGRHWRASCRKWTFDQPMGGVLASTFIDGTAEEIKSSGRFNLCPICFK